MPFLPPIMGAGGCTQAPVRQEEIDDISLCSTGEKSMGAGAVPGNYRPDLPDGKIKPKLIFISDPGQDLDDEMTFIMLRHLVEARMVEVLGIVATLAPAFDRARLTRGTLDTLGLHSVPVGLGSDGGDIQGVHKADTFVKWAQPYMPPRHSSVFEPGRSLLYRLFQQAEPKSLTVVVIASLKDIALFIREESQLFEAKTREVVVMGGAEPWENTPDNVLKPDTSHNQEFDKAASAFLFERCQACNVPLILVSRWAAYASKVPRSCYDELAALGSWVGCRLRNAQRASIEALWNRACGTGAEEREGLPERCDRTWFLKTFCDGDPASGRKRGDTIWDLLTGFMQYDTIATLVAVPELRERFFKPTIVNGPNGTKNMVVGVSETDHNIAHPQELEKFLQTGFINGLALNTKRRVQFILLSQPKWNNRCEELLACVVLRTLFAMGILDCVGMVISPGPDRHERAEGETTVELAKEVESMLKSLGLAHVPVLVAESYSKEEGKVSGADHLASLYKKVSPAGVSLVVTGAVGEVADFSEALPEVFQQKTQSVILLGGAHPSAERTPEGVSTGQTVLAPDDAAQNNGLDMPAAERLHKLAQEMLVPLVIISRHCAGAVQIPRSFFDNLNQNGGSVGKKLKEVQQSCIVKLFSAATSPPENRARRRSLPGRCDAAWFKDSFCGGKVPDESKGDDGLWEVVESFNVYSLLAVLMAMPPFRNKYIKGTPTTVRSVRHQLIGMSKEDHGVIDTSAVRGMIFQCLSSGVLLNESKFDIGPNPERMFGKERVQDKTDRTSVRPDGSPRQWQWESHRTSLAWMLPGQKGSEQLWS